MATLTPNLITPGNGFRMDRTAGTSDEQHIPLTRRRVRHDIVDSDGTFLLLLGAFDAGVCLLLLFDNSCDTLLLEVESDLFDDVVIMSVSTFGSTE